MDVQLAVGKNMTTGLSIELKIYLFLVWQK